MNRFRQFMYGRYGGDMLGNALLVVSMALLLLGLFVKWQWISLLAILLLAFAYFRMFSKNTTKRFAENQKYLLLHNRVKKFFSDAKFRFQDRKTHKYYACPSCKQRLRVPKGKGKINIKCPHCQTSFMKKS